MRELIERIRLDGEVLSGNVLKVDSFLNHQIDPVLMDHIGKAFYDLFKDEGVTRVLTVETGGIAPACSAAKYFGVPLIYAKKADALNMDADCFSADVYSYTKKTAVTIKVGRRFLSDKDRVLIIDDFLAEGSAALGMLEICHQASAEVAGVGICIEKKFQQGSKLLANKGVRVESLAVIEEMRADGIVFAE